MATYRILSLDGGGTWALLQVMALQKIYADDTPGHQVLKDFNLVAANGAGCITLAGLMLDMPLSDILTKWFLNEDLRRGILAPPRGLLKKLFGNGAKYSTKQKRAALRTLLGDLAERNLAKVFDGSKRPPVLLPQILICAYDCDRNRAEFFRSDRASRCASLTASDPMLVDAIHAATTAPYPLFDLPAEGPDGRFWDGAAAGLYNPILAAVTEARANRVAPGEIRVLSIGTGTIQLPITNGVGNSKLLRDRDSIALDASTLLRTVLYDPADSMTFVTHVMLGQVMPGDTQDVPVSGAIIRLSPVVRPLLQRAKWVSPEGLSDDEVEKLASTGLDAIEPNGVELIRLLGERWVEGKVLNQPIRAGREFSYEIGKERFPDAVTAWKAIRA